MTKLILLISFISSSFFVLGQSQGLRIGTHFGIGEARIKDASIQNQTGKLCLQAGFALTYQFTENFGLYGNMLLTSKGAHASGFTRETGFLGSTDYPYKQNFALYYAEFPIMAKIGAGINDFYFKAFAGPSINFNIYGKEDKEYEDHNYNDQNGFVNREITDLNLVEYSFIAGAGIDIEVARKDVLFIEVRESIGINSFGKINNQDAKNQYFTIAVGYLYKY
jgi:hypothetical protein